MSITVSSPECSGVPGTSRSQPSPARITCENYLSVVQRKLLTPDDFANLDILAERLGAFEHRYNNTARPFDWRFNHDDRYRLLD